MKKSNLEDLDFAIFNAQTKYEDLLDMHNDITTIFYEGLERFENSIYNSLKDLESTNNNELLDKCKLDLITAKLEFEKDIKPDIEQMSDSMLIFKSMLTELIDLIEQKRLKTISKELDNGK